TKVSILSKSMERSEPSSRMIDFLNASMERSESSSRVSAPYTSYYDYVKSRIRIGVEGYSTSLKPIDLYRALESLFKTCGEVHNIQIRRDPVTNALQRSCIVILRGEGAGDKALQLNGSDIGGSKIVVTSLPSELSDLSTGLSTDVLAARSVAHNRRKRSEGISVTGYDTSLTKDDLKNALTNHFSTCGEITDVFVLNSRALVYFYGLGSNNRAVQLSGTDLGGCTLVVKALPYPKPKGSAWTRLRYRFRSATLSTITGWAHQISEPSSRMIAFLNASMERSESSSRVSAPIRIGVEGYSTSLKPIDLYRALESLFKTCGEVHNIQIRRDPVTNALQRSCIVILRGEGAGDKALQLNGSDIGGSKIVVTSLPPELSELSTGLSTDVLAARSVAHNRRKRSEGISVTGYDTSLTKDDLKNALTNHFSTCGEITDVFVLNSRALVYFYGLGSNNRAVQLSGTDLGGSTLVVKALPYPKPKGSAWTRLRYRFRSATLSTITGWAHQIM
ncbi:hypothetical protein HID58_050279, partial [Brassica napus]